MQKQIPFSFQQQNIKKYKQIINQYLVILIVKLFFSLQRINFNYSLILNQINQYQIINQTNCTRFISNFQLSMQSQNQQSIKNQSQLTHKLHYLAILNNILQQNTNHTQIKQQLKRKQKRIEISVYTGLVQTEPKYLETIGLLDNEQPLFTYIGKILNQKQQIFINSVVNGPATVKSKIKPPPQPEAQPCQQIINQVWHVLNNVDLPLSLFKRNDNYWSIDNPKTLQAKQYLNKMHQQDQKFKLLISKKKNQIQKQKQVIRNKTIDIIQNQQQHHKKQLQSKINKKLQELKKNSKQRQKTISQSVQFMKQRGKPLFIKIEKQFKSKIQIPEIQQKKRKLSEIRQVMRSVPLQEIQSHRQRYQKLKSQHQNRTIVNQPLNISFKSHFYHQIKTMNSSRFDESIISLYQKRLQYSRLVKQNHKPAVDQTKKQQIQSRIKLMKKRRARVKKNKKQTKNSDDDDQEQQQQPEQQEQSQEEPEPQQNSDDDSDKPRPQKDDQYQPSQHERYKMGLNYLKVARKLAAKKSSTQTNFKQKDKNQITQKNKTIKFSNPNETNDEKGRQTVQQSSENKKQKFIWVSKYDQQPKKQQRIQYKNYLKEIQKKKSKQQNSNEALMDTSQIKKQIQKAYGTNSRLNDSNLPQKSKRKNQTTKQRVFNIESQILYQTNLQNKIRNIQQRAKHQQQLLKYKRVNRQQKINKKIAIDDAVVDTIKARLLMMHKTLDK